MLWLLFAGFIDPAVLEDWAWQENTGGNNLFWSCSSKDKL
jgi:hypothetical protein